MAAGSAEADTVPGVGNLAVSGGKKQNAHEWRAIGPKAGLISVQYPATAHNPGGMPATTPERPAACDAVTTINDHGVAKRSQGPGNSNMWIAAVDFVCGRSRQVAPKDAVLATIGHAPADGTISSRDLFDDANKRHRIGFLTAYGSRDPQAK
jgi:hypothetical protein